MVYGDSNIYAAFSEAQYTFSAQLESKLEAKTKTKFQVINAGVRGFGTDQVLLRIESEIEAWEPDLVIVHIFADNDFGDVIRNGLFRIGKEEMLVYSPPTRPKESNSFRELVKTLYISNTLSFWRTYLSLMFLDKKAYIQRLIRSINTEYASYLNPSLPMPRSDHYDLDIAVNPDAKSSRLKIRLMDMITKRIINSVQNRSGSKVLFMIQPSSRDTSTNVVVNYTTFGKYSPNYRRSNLTRAVENILKGHRAKFVNLFDSFLSEGDSPYYFLFDNDHWNDAGQELAAQLVADFIVQNYDFHRPKK